MNHFQNLDFGHLVTILSKNCSKITWAVLQKWTLAKIVMYTAILGDELYTMCFNATKGSVVCPNLGSYWQHSLGPDLQLPHLNTSVYIQ